MQDLNWLVLVNYPEITHRKGRKYNLRNFNFKSNSLENYPGTKNVFFQNLDLILTFLLIPYLIALLSDLTELCVLLFGNMIGIDLSLPIIGININVLQNLDGTGVESGTTNFNMINPVQSIGINKGINHGLIGLLLIKISLKMNSDTPRRLVFSFIGFYFFMDDFTGDILELNRGHAYENNTHPVYRIFDDSSKLKKWMYFLLIINFASKFKVHIKEDYRRFLVYLTNLRKHKTKFHNRVLY